jgi:diguanylate cyclase (GGDEF)-like protein
MDSTIGLAIQCVGIFLVTLLSFFMLRSIESAATKYWTIAWSCLSISLLSLYIGFKNPDVNKIFYSLYFLGEYVFGLMFIAGCRSHAVGARLRRSNFYLLIPFILLAAGLPYLSDDFNDLFVVQASMMAALFATAFYALRPARRREGGTSLGVRVMSLALFLLALDFLHYVPLFGSRNGAWGIGVPQGYLKYTSIFDLILEILLGFGTVMVLMEGVRREVEDANRELTTARDQLEFIARVDPLTEALNRHAFHSLLSKGQSKGEERAAGSVAVIDINNLKPINDSLGHMAGDMAIRAVAHAVRSIIRADDMLFRWGGDEFLLLMFGIPDREVRRRMENLNTTLSKTRLQGHPIPISISVSYGLSGFNSMTELERAIEQADKAMYERKQIYKAQALKESSTESPEGRGF